MARIDTAQLGGLRTLGLAVEHGSLTAAAARLVALATLAEEGAGVAFLPDYVARDGIARGTLRRVLPRTTIARYPMHALYPSRRHLARRVQVVLDALVQPRGGALRAAAPARQSKSDGAVSSRNARDVLPSRPPRHSRP
jgi:DNA-binding transcriptional LysR family regulator